MNHAFTLVAVALILLSGAAAVDEAIQSGGTTHSITDETWTPQTGTFVELNESKLSVRYDRTVVVRDENNTQMLAGDDYEWNQSNGTVKALAGGRLDGDSSASIDYAYVALTDSQEQFASMTGDGLDAIAPLVIFCLLIGLFVAGLNTLGGI